MNLKTRVIPAGNDGCNHCNRRDPVPVIEILNTHTRMVSRYCTNCAYDLSCTLENFINNSIGAETGPTR